MHQSAGVPHAYLEGVGLEAMSNSNHVLRGGLTAKHIDVEELLRIVDFSTQAPRKLTAKPVEPNDALSCYPTTAEEFTLCRIDLARRDTYIETSTPTARILILIKGEINISTQCGRQYDFVAGTVFMMPPSITAEITARSDATLFQAAVP